MQVCVTYVVTHVTATVTDVSVGEWVVWDFVESDLPVVPGGHVLCQGARPPRVRCRVYGIQSRRSLPRLCRCVTCFIRVREVMFSCKCCACFRTDTVFFIQKVYFFSALFETLYFFGQLLKSQMHSLIIVHFIGESC